MATLAKLGAAELTWPGLLAITYSAITLFCYYVITLICALRLLPALIAGVFFISFRPPN
jgi:hypothetical protein